MKIKIKIPDGFENEQVHLFVTHDADMTRKNECVKNIPAIHNVGYRVGTKELLSMQKKDGYLYVEIDDAVEAEEI